MVVGEGNVANPKRSYLERTSNFEFRLGDQEVQCLEGPTK